ncbi:MAG: protein kinase [Polyangiaceae bacterium]
MVLECKSERLADVANGRPMLVDDASGHSTGVRLVRRLGEGGMSTVVLGERVEPATGRLIDEDTPRQVAVKLLTPATATALGRFGLSPIDFVKKEVVALQRLSALRPRPSNVIEYYGCGELDVSVRGRVLRLPWLLVEFVDGGNAGLSLTDRVAAAPEGIDPIRAHRLASAIGRGLSAIHSVGVVHRDLKPENILITGPVDDEQPKLSDCGIARVSGMETTLLAAVTPAYGALEQFLPATPTGNPLVGPWTDVFAFAAVLWFVVGAEQWHVDLAQQPVNPDWLAGDRRSLRSAGRLHPAFAASPKLHELDAVLRRGSSPKLPKCALVDESGARALRIIEERFPAVARGEERYADLASFMADVEPLLSAISDEWRTRAGREKRPATQHRRTMALPTTELLDATPLYQSRVVPPERKVASGVVTDPVLERDLIAHYPDGTSVARSGAGLLYLRQQRAYVIRLPDDKRLPEILERALSLHYADMLGCAIVSPAGVAFVRSNVVRTLSPPTSPGRAVGPIVSAHVFSGRLAIVTDETEDTEGAVELWWTHDAVAWSPPVAVSLNSGRVLASSAGPYGSLLVGSREGRGGKVAATAAFSANDGSNIAFARGLGTLPSLTAALAGLEHESWAASGAHVVNLARGAVTAETVDTPADQPGTWARLGLDLYGTPWLLTETALHVREVRGGAPIWRRIHTRSDVDPPFVTLAFTSRGPFALDREFNAVVVQASVADATSGKIA